MSRPRTQATCSEAGREEMAVARGLCNRHYRHYYYRGELGTRPYAQNVRRDVRVPLDRTLLDELDRYAAQQGRTTGATAQATIRGFLKSRREKQHVAGA